MGKQLLPRFRGHYAYAIYDFSSISGYSTVFLSIRNKPRWLCQRRKELRWSFQKWVLMLNQNAQTLSFWLVWWTTSRQLVHTMLSLVLENFMKIIPTWLFNGADHFGGFSIIYYHVILVLDQNNMHFKKYIMFGSSYFGKTSEIKTPKFLNIYYSAKKFVKSNKSISRIMFFVQLPF